MRKIAFANLKGGVGKSTTTLIAAEAFAMKGKRVLVLDLDPQANCSFMLLSSDGVSLAEASHRTLPHFLLALGDGDSRAASGFIASGGSDLVEVSASKTGRIDVLPSVPRMWFAEFDYSEALFRKNRDPVECFRVSLEQALHVLEKSYDVVLIDCPPGFSVSTRAGLMLADAIVSPTIADEVSVKSLADFTQYGVRGILSERATDRHFVTISKFQANVTSQIQILRRLEQQYDVLNPPIRHTTDMVRAAYRIAMTSERKFEQKYGIAAPDARALGAKILQYVQ